MSKNIKFEQIILQNGKMNAAYVKFPFSTLEVFGKKGQVKIKAVFDDLVEYRGSLAKMGEDCHILILTQDIRKKLGKSFGDNVKITLWEDTEIRKVEIPEDVSCLFDIYTKEFEIFQKLSYTHQKEYIQSIIEAKKRRNS